MSAEPNTPSKPPPSTIVLITGAAGWLGSSLASALLTAAPTHARYQLILTDIVQPHVPACSDLNGTHAPQILALKADLNDLAQIQSLFRSDELGCPDIVYCMHGIMSRGSEDDFDLGIKVNVDSVRMLLEATRREGARVRKVIKFVFTSSLAVYGGPLLSIKPEMITSGTNTTPESAYGSAKLICERFIDEYTRRGFIDGRIVRLPTIVVRPGVPSGATSAFISGIIRDPLKGLRTTCPIGTSLSSPELSLPLWIASASTTVKNLIHASIVPSSSFVPHTRVVCLPGFTVTLREELEALEEVGGKQALEKVEFKADEVNRRVVSKWPARFDVEYALEMGFVRDERGLVPIVKKFKEDVDAGRV